VYVVDLTGDFFVDGFNLKSVIDSLGDNGLSWALLVMQF